MKMVDTLEKYQQRVVNTKSESGKEFIQFKRQLYQMYEVQNRSIDEHELFSSKLERQNLRWLYQANMDFIDEMQRVNTMDALVDHGALKGSIFKAKMLSTKRLYGMGSFGLAGILYANMSMLSLMLGPTIPALGMVGAAMYGARQFAQTDTVSRIDYIKEGEFAGRLRVTVQKTPIVSYTIVVNPGNCRSICAVGADDIGEDDAEGNVLHVEEYFNESTGQTERQGLFTVPADAHRDKTTLEWIFAAKNDASETDELFNDFIAQRHNNIAQSGGLTGLRAIVASQTGYANVGDEGEINALLK